MQPYFFPYIGYYQLAYECDTFVFFDDANYIKKGYINRNSIKLNDVRHDFSLPVSKISQNRKICEHDYTGDFSVFLKTIEQAYKKAPHFESGLSVIKEVLRSSCNNVAKTNSRSLTVVFEYLGLKRNFRFSSDIKLDSNERGQDRIIKLCKALNIVRYRNSIGGQQLYDQSTFEAAGIEIKFIQSRSYPYQQGTSEFLPNLSMIDAIMYCDKESIKGQLQNYSLL